VGVAVVITLLITLFASWAYGFTLNRVSLFALIFSIGILVDDAIVVVENVHRYLHTEARSIGEAIPAAVDEVGGPTILATLTVIAALLPMAFVTGLMGPYMSPIPINASMGMLISLVVAFVITPWLCFRLMRPAPAHAGATAESESDDASHRGESETSPAGHGAATGGFEQRLFRRLIGPFLGGGGAVGRRALLFVGVLVLIVAALSLGVFKLVVLKMLPFDNKGEFQVVVDMPEGTPLEQTTRVLDALGREIVQHPNVSDIQIYAGTAAPINFNGLVRQYYLREEPHQGDIQVNLSDKQNRKASSHDIARELRGTLQTIGAPFGANVKIVEVPPGPPVMAPLVAEVYGPDYAGQIEVANRIREVFEETPDIVDVDDTIEVPSRRLVLAIDREKAALLGISQERIADALNTIIHGKDVSYLHGQQSRFPIPIRVEYPHAEKADLNTILALNIRSNHGHLVPVGEVVQVLDQDREYSIHHKDLLPVVYTTGDMSGRLDSPVYGMFDIFGRLGDEPIAYGEPVDQHLISPPDDRFAYTVKWDGEWQITYETFRDMGLAYSVGLLLIYLLLVGQFRSYLVPLVIMAPIPLTLIGIMPAHALLGAQFTATSMIGLIALAGIIVRNSILLVDFINTQLRAGDRLEDAVVTASAVRAKPIVLTGLAAMAGAVFILDDPIFSGLAISLISGILVSTLLTLVLIPVLYYALIRKSPTRSAATV
jgi:multidrug efflux pump subunit AcrB